MVIHVCLPSWLQRLPAPQKHASRPNPSPAAKSPLDWLLRPAQWQSSHQQDNTATARRSPTRPPRLVVVVATGSTRTLPCLPGKLSMPRAATSSASPRSMRTSVLASSSRANTARSPTAFTSCELGSTSTFEAWVLTRGAATDSGQDCTPLRGWTGCRCAGCRTEACALPRSGNGLAREPEDVS